MEGQPCYKLELKAKDRSVAYDRVVTGCAATAPSSRCAPSTTRSPARKLKWLTLSEVATPGRRARARPLLIMESALEAGARTALRSWPSRTTPQLDDRLFTPERAGARRVRRASRGRPVVARWLPPRRPRGGAAAVELGLENFYYRTGGRAAQPRQRARPRADDEDLLRGTLRWKESRGAARGWWCAASWSGGFGGQDRHRAGRPARPTLQYGFGDGGHACAPGKQRIAWGSGFAWNPTNRLEPPKNPLNTGLEQEGARRGARWTSSPRAWAGLILVAARSRHGRRPTCPSPARAPRGARPRVRARFLVRDTDLALVVSRAAATSARSSGLDVGRDARRP